LAIVFSIQPKEISMSKSPLKNYEQPKSVSEIIGFAPPGTIICAISGSIYFDDGSGGGGSGGSGDPCSVAANIQVPCTSGGTPIIKCAVAGNIR
jgi:hypothetical protein